MPEQRPDYDVLIVGGGLIGASLALALCDQPLRVGLIEPEPPTGSGPLADARILALGYATRRILEALGLWSAVEVEATPIRAIHVSDRGRLGAARLQAEAEGVVALGYILPARALAQALYGRLTEVRNLDLLCPARLVDFETHDAAISTRVTHQARPRTLTTRLLVGADGTRSAVRTALGIGTWEHDYGQTAVITRLQCQQPHRGTAYERFTPNGPLALLPLDSDRCAAIWTLPRDEAEAVLRLDAQEFASRLQRQLGARLGTLAEIGPREAYPLHLVRAREQHGARALLLGNAAHTLHPVAGQGFNLGLRDIAALAEVLSDAVRAGEDPGTAAVLARYIGWRGRDQWRMIALSDGLVRLFSNDFGPLALARDLGLVALDLLPPAKHLLCRFAMGLSGRQPRLTRGLAL